MKDNLSIVILMIIFVMLIVFFPLYNYFERQDDMSYNLVLRETTTFVDKVLSNGYISNDTYQEFLDSLANTGNLYDVQLEAHKRIITSDTQNNAKGYKDYIEQYEIDYNDDILSIDPTKNNASLTNKQIKGGIYTLEVGDEFYVKLKNSSTTMAGAIFNSIISTSSTERIVVNYGGIVKNNSWKKVDANYFTDISKINTYKITYHANSKGGSGAYYNIGGEKKDTFESSDFLEGTSQRITPPPATRADYTFKGYSDENHTYSYGDEYTFNSNIDLYAIWEKNKTDGNYEMDGKYYDTLKDAFSNVSQQNGTPITVKKNVTGEVSATLSGYYVNLILNNKTITMKENSTINISSGTLNLVGSGGTITSNGNTINLINTGNLIVGAKMNVVSTGGIAIKNGGTGTVNITNATVSGYNIGIQNNNKKGIIKITGASKVSSNNAYKQTIQGILESTAEAIQMTNGKLILGDSTTGGSPEIVGSKFGVSLWDGTIMVYNYGIVKSNNNSYSTPITPEKGYESKHNVRITNENGKLIPAVARVAKYKYISITK